MTDTERAEYDDVVRKLTIELERVIAENARLRNSENSAHSVLREVYNDPSASPHVRVLAAKAAISHESAPLKPQPAPLDLVAEKPLPLAEVVRRQRARADALMGLPQGHPEFKRWVWREDMTCEALDGPGSGSGGDSSNSEQS